MRFMSLVDVILSRRSIRHYDQRQIPKDVLDTILEAGRYAPSAANMQPWHFIVVTNEEIKKELSKGLFSKFLKNSPLVIVGCCHTSLFVGKWSKIDTTIALQNMVIAAWAFGVGSCWIGSFKENRVRRLLNIPVDWNVVALISFGYPVEIPKPHGRKPIQKIVSYNKF